MRVYTGAVLLLPFGHQPQDIISADFIVSAQRPQVPDRHFIDPVFVTGIDLLCGPQNMSDRALFQIPVFPKFPEDFPILLHRIHHSCICCQNCTHTKYDVLTDTLEVVYNLEQAINHIENHQEAMRGSSIMVTNLFLSSRLEVLPLTDTMGTKEASEKWGYSQTTISGWCRKHIIPATQFAKGSPWQIPKDAKCPRPIQKKGQEDSIK